MALLHRRFRRRCKTTTLWLRLKGAVMSKCCKSPGFTGQVSIQKASESESSDDASKITKASPKSGAHAIPEINP